MDLLDELENWQIGGAAIFVIGIIGLIGYLSMSSAGETQSYLLQGDLVDTSTETSYFEPQTLSITETRSCDSDPIAQKNVSTGQIEIAFNTTKTEDSNWISLCLEADGYESELSEQLTVQDLHNISNGPTGSPLDDEPFYPNEISWIGVQGQSVAELRNVDFKQAVE